MAKGEKAGIRVVINDVKSGNSFQRELPREREGLVAGKKIGDKLEGGLVGLPGYSLQITGGSDDAGFPMRPDVQGQKRVKAVLGGGTGVRHLPKGGKRKKLVTGNTVGASIAQLNCRISEYGPQPLQELGFAPKPKEEKKTEEKK